MIEIPLMIIAWAVAAIVCGFALVMVGVALITVWKDWREQGK